MASKIKQQLLQKFDSLFERKSLEKNTYLFNQLKINLELPLSVIYKQKKIQMITSDQRIILQALKECDRIKVNEQKKSVILKLPAYKTRVVVKKVSEEHAVTQQLQSILSAALKNVQYTIEFEKIIESIVLTLPQENIATNIYNVLSTDSAFGFPVSLEDGDIYLELKESIEKVRKQKKQKMQNQNTGISNTTQQFDMNAYYNYFQQWGNSYYQFPYEQRPRGPGYTRRAVESDDEIVEEKKPKYRLKQQKPAEIVKQVATSTPVKQVQKRIRLNSENFPSLDDAKIEDKLLKAKYNKKQIVQIYNKIITQNGKIKMSKELQSSKIPLINPEGNFRLEVTKAGGRKSSTFDSPKLTGFRKSSN